MICISVNLFCSYIVFPPLLFNCLPLFYFTSSSFLETTLEIFIRCIVNLHFFQVSYRKVIVFPWCCYVFLIFFMFFEVLHYWFHIWNNYLPPVCTDWLWRETPSGNPVGDFEAIPNLVYWYPCSILFVSFWEDFHCLAFSVLQRQARCWQPPICSH